MAESSQTTAPDASQSTSMRFTILGCGSSGGVPRAGGNWGACNPENPKNKRSRCSLLVERTSDKGKTTVVIDTGCDLREQLLRENVRSIDAILYTHEHADHVHGIDDLRVFAIDKRDRVDVYIDKRTAQDIKQKFSYCFETPPGSPYPAILRDHEIVPYQAFSIEGEGGAIEVMPIPQVHGNITSLGFRVGNVAYSADISDLNEESEKHLQDLDIWIVDALRYIPHPSHFNVEQALAWVDKVRPKKAILTNMHIDLDYEELKSQLPETVEPAYDGLVIDI